jgi:hypothetical protein
MAGYFSAEKIGELSSRLGEARRQSADLREKYILRTYKSDRAAEYAKHGFCRRLDTLIHCIENVYEILPPEREDIPERDQVISATISIQAFVLNAFGCLDNLAWIWVFEKNVKRKDGNELERGDVGLGKKDVRRSFSDSFREYLNSRKEWLGNLIAFRDSLSHRIPLYIPPYVVDESKIDEYKKLEEAAFGDQGRADPKEYARLRAEQRKLCHFRPWMTHSVYEQSPQVEFHSQLLNDYVTIDEHGRTMLEELG